MSASPGFRTFSSCAALGIKPQPGDVVLVWPDPPPGTERKPYEVTVLGREPTDFGIIFELGGVRWALPDSYCAPVSNSNG